jgi:hypothetical protein
VRQRGEVAGQRNQRRRGEAERDRHGDGEHGRDHRGDPVDAPRPRDADRVADAQPAESDRHRGAERQPEGRDQRHRDRQPRRERQLDQFAEQRLKPGRRGGDQHHRDRERRDERAARLAEPCRDQRPGAGEQQQREQDDRERVRGESEEQHEALYQHHLEHEEAEPDRREEGQR